MKGTRFDKYIIEEELGQGGMGTVYRAYHTGLNASVVLKMAARNLIDSHPKFREQFAREAQTIARLNHYAIVPVYDYGEHEGQPYIVMRLMEGGDLERRIQNGTLSLMEASLIVERVADALDKAHAGHVIHRDIKPSNVLFDNEGLAYLGDFGIAKLTKGTSAMTTIGTWPYMAPEQWMGEPADGRTDIYQLGVMLYQMLTADVPFEADNVAGWMFAHTQGEIPKITEKRPEYPPALDAIMSKALAKEPNDRFQTAGDFSAELKDLTRRLAAPSTAQFAPTPAPIPTPLPQRTPPPTPQPQARRPSRAVPPQASKKAPNSGRPAWLLPLLGGLAAIAIIAAVIFGLRERGNGAVAEVTSTPEPTAEPTEPPTTVPTDEPTTIVVIAETDVPTEEPPTATPEPQAGDTRLTERDGMVQVFIPAGTFLMGSSEEELQIAFDRACEQNPDGAICDRSVYAAEAPQHEVSLDAYWFDRTEITNAMYDLCIADGGCTAPSSDFIEGLKMDVEPSVYFEDAAFANHPIVGVNWEQAAAYCAWADRALPTEAQWERAARGDDDLRIFPFGNEINCTQANFAGCVGRPTEVGTLPAGASPFDIFDLSGNVWEWVNDWYDPAYYAESPLENPDGPLLSPENTKIVRGSSWSGPDVSVRVANRGRVPPNFVQDNLGFRCAELDG